MAALLLLVVSILVLDHWVLRPLVGLFTLLVDGSLGAWLLLLAGMWLVSGPPRRS